MVKSDDDLVRAIYDHLGGDSGIYRGVAYDLTENNELGELLDTPHIWGKAPFPLDVAVDRPGQNLLDAIKNLISNAVHTVDISTLALPDGKFVEAIREGLNVAAATRPNLVVRILVGKPVNEGSPDLEKWLEDLNPPQTIAVYCAAQETAISSWNHAKLVIADGAKAICGGHNMYSNVYCGPIPVHDVSMSFAGPAVATAQRFLNLLWTDAAKQMKGKHWFHHAWSKLRLMGETTTGALTLIHQRETPVANATTRLLPVGRLGDNVISSTREANASREARLYAVQQAKERVRLSQQAFDSPRFGFANADWALLQALGELAKRNISIEIVISDKNAGLPGDGYGSSGLEQLGYYLWKATAEALGLLGMLISRAASGLLFGSEVNEAVDRTTKVCSDAIRVAPLAFSPPPGLWKWQVEVGSHLKEYPPGNHAKVWIVDERAYYIGSDNAYAILESDAGLQEFGIIGDRWTRLEDYWTELWSYSSPRCLDWKDVMPMARLVREYYRPPPPRT